MNRAGFWTEIGKETGEYKEGGFSIKLYSPTNKWEAWDERDLNPIYCRPFNTFEEALSFIRQCQDAESQE